jgi:hypothetical protein
MSGLGLGAGQAPKERLSSNCLSVHHPRKYAVSALLLLLCASAAGGAESDATRVSLHPESWEFAPDKVQFGEHDSRPAMRFLAGAGQVVLRAPDFSDGTVEFDFQPLDPRFATIYFRWQGAAENECFYIRTGRAGDPTAVDAVQYAAFRRNPRLARRREVPSSRRRQRW